MLLTKEMLDQGASDRGGHSRKQVEILGGSWPLTRGWKESLIGREVSDEAFAEFVKLAVRAATVTSSSNGVHQEATATVDQGRRPGINPRVLYIYALALEGGFFYVGMTDNFERRFRQHLAGIGADWTALHRPLHVLRCVCTGTSDMGQAAKMEDEVTLALMLRHGADKVRGGQYANVSQELVDKTLRSRGHWDKVKRGELDQQAFEAVGSWAEALNDFLKVALAYYDAGAPVDQCDAVFSACYRLTRYRYWREEFEPALSWHFWSKKGVLPVLLTFKHRRVIGSRLKAPYEVLAAALTRGRRNEPTLRRLFLLAWKGYLAPCEPAQAESIERQLRSLAQQGNFDDRYNDFVSVLLPELRHLLR